MDKRFNGGLQIVRLIAGETVFDVDVKGGLNLKRYFGDRALAIFVKVPSLDILEERLRHRGTESEDSISRRLFKASFEMAFEEEFDITLLNEDLEQSCREAQALYENFTKQSTTSGS